jgi:hypothetical protein
MSGISVSRATLPRAMRSPGVIHALPAGPARHGRRIQKMLAQRDRRLVEIGHAGHRLHIQVLHERDNVLDRALM